MFSQLYFSVYSDFVVGGFFLLKKHRGLCFDHTLIYRIGILKMDYTSKNSQGESEANSRSGMLILALLFSQKSL